MTVTTAPPATPPSPRRRKAPRGRRLVTAFGVLLILAGVGLLGWFAWQYFGTNIVSKREAAAVKEETVAQWEQGVEGDAVALLRIPRFGDDFEAPVLKGFDDGTLARGVGMYPDGQLPGEKGNFVVAGHRVTHGEPFADFLKLREGDKVEVETRTHVYTYVLDDDGDDITVPFTTSWPLWKVPDPDWDNSPPTERLMTLVTCSEIFHTDNRNVVVAHLVQSIDKSKTAPPPDRAAEPTPDTEG